MKLAEYYISGRRPHELVLFIALATLLISRASATADEPETVDDRFANEPKRVKSETPIRFSRSWDDATTQAQRTGRRLLAYFTGAECGWCRAMEKRSFTDAEVVELSKNFVCVEINISEARNSRLADKYRIDSIPRTIIFTPDEKIIERRTRLHPGY